MRNEPVTLPDERVRLVKAALRLSADSCKLSSELCHTGDDLTRLFSVVNSFSGEVLRVVLALDCVQISVEAVEPAKAGVK